MPQPLVWCEDTMTHVRRAKPKPGRPTVKGKGVAKEPVVHKQTAEKLERQGKVVTLLAAGASEEEALKIVGYSPRNKVCRSPAVLEAVADIRARLQQTPGYRLEDSAEFYRDISEDASNEVPDRLRARGRLDAVLGHDAAKEVKVEEKRTELRMAVSLLSDLRLSFADLMKLTSADVVEVVDEG